jgi:molybdopterin converting factor small subunit
MKLVEIQKKAGNKIFCFTNTKNDGFILESIKIHINKNRIIQQIDIQELKFGFCSFGLQGELLQCEAWESEEEAQSISNLSRHYTTISANDKKGYAYAKKIYRSLDKTLEDNYLRFILKDFIFQRRVLKFEEKYYSIYSPPKEEVVENNSYTSQEKEGIEILCAEALNFHLPSIKRTLLLSGFCMLVVFVLILLPFHKESKWDNTDNWPQPLEFFYFNSYEAPTSFIHRKRDYSKILQGNLFPTLPLVEKTLTEAIDDYTQNLSKIENELEREVKKIYFSNNEEFFDTIYKLDKEDQVIIFHNQYVKPSGLSNFELAEALSRLYRENLTRLLYTYSPNPIIIASDYLDSQTNKDSLIRYLFFYPQFSQYRNVD